MDRVDSMWACLAKMDRIDAWKVLIEHVGCAICKAASRDQYRRCLPSMFDTEADAWKYIYTRDWCWWYVHLPCTQGAFYPSIDQTLAEADDILYSHVMHDSILYICTRGGSPIAKIWVEKTEVLRAVIVDDRRPARPRPCVADAPAPLER